MSRNRSADLLPLAYLLGSRASKRETSVEPHKTPYTLEQLLTTVKALHIWLIETTQSRPARIDEPRMTRKTST